MVQSLQSRSAGDRITLPKNEAKHLTTVRRLSEGAAIELFDEAGRVSMAVLRQADGWSAELSETPREQMSAGATFWVATPKGDRASWLAEKLSELGAARWVPLVSKRTVVVPGEGKLERFRRLSLESAKQCRRAGVMGVDAPATLHEALHAVANESAIVLSTQHENREIPVLGSISPDAARHVFIGPEGGWSDEELDAFETAGIAAVSLGENVLRIETAALAAAAILHSRLERRDTMSS